MRTKLLLAFLILTIPLASFSPFFRNNIVILTIPKAGTHLIGKAVELITERPLTFCQFNRIGHNRILCDHLWPHLNHLRTSPFCKKIIFIRDPRDILISLMHWIEQQNDWAGGLLSSSEISKFQCMSKDQKIAFLIRLPDRCCGLHYFMNTAVSWMCEPDVNVLRFEDLVGSAGGGSDQRQFETLCWLSNFLEFRHSEEEIHDIADNLFGGTNTFRKGKIGSWKKEFSEENIRLFKTELGFLLIQMGYETDFDW